MSLFNVSNIICFVIMMLLLIFSFIKDKNKKFDIKQLAVMALLMSLSIILGSYLKIAIPLFGAETFEIKFDSLPIILIGLKYGMFKGAFSGVLVDLLQLLLAPSSFPYFGFTLNMLLYGLFGGIIGTSSLKDIVKIAIVVIICELFVSYFLTVIWLWCMFGLPIWTGALVRSVRFVIMVGIDIIILNVSYNLLKNRN